MALTVALHIEPQLVHSLVIERKPLFTLIEAVVDWMGRHVVAVLAGACAKSIDMALVVLTVLTVLNLDHSV